MRKADVLQYVGLSLWVTAIIAGFTALTTYSSRAASVGAMAAETWPLSVARTEGKDTLILFLHPKCGCSRATLAELETLLPEMQNKVDIIVNFYYPAKEGEAFARTKLFDMASRFPGVKVRFDSDAKTADLFGVKASGEAMYFSARGDLKFHGGLTPLRGHTGDSFGRQAVLELASGREPKAQTSKVFGCQLKEELSTEVALVQ